MSDKVPLVVKSLFNENLWQLETGVWVRGESGWPFIELLANNVLVGTVEIAPLPRLVQGGIGFASPFTTSWLPLAPTVPDPGGLIGGQHGQGIPIEIESIILLYVFYMWCIVLIKDITHGYDNFIIWFSSPFLLHKIKIIFRCISNAHVLYLMQLKDVPLMLHNNKKAKCYFHGSLLPIFCIQ